MSTRGLVSDIQRYSLHDGPGIRTVIFLKSCPLICLWCANPESQKPHPELMLTPATCIGCDRCVRACPLRAITVEVSADKDPVPVIHWPNCNACLLCADTCPTGTLMRVGDDYSSDEIVQVLQQDRAYYDRSNGGITLSGGEPTAQPEFSRAILRSCQDLGIHTAIETCGACEWELLDQLLPFSDRVYFDLKHLDTKLHTRFTQAGNRQILENLSLLIQHHTDLVIRMPLIPGFNDDDDHLISLASHLTGFNPQPELELIPYHRLGSGKYFRLGRRYAFEDSAAIEPEILFERQQFLRAQGVRIR